VQAIAQSPDMSDQSEYPSESMPGQDSGLRPLSNADDMSLGNPSNSELSRIMSRAGISLANGFPLDDDDDDEEEADEDYVAVDQDEASDHPYWFRRAPAHTRTKLDDLHPFVQLLSTSNVEDCVKVEAAFPEQERCSHDKVWLPQRTMADTQFLTKHLIVHLPSYKMSGAQPGPLHSPYSR
jgi:hypothetical protein